MCAFLSLHPPRPYYPNEGLLIQYDLLMNKTVSTMPSGVQPCFGVDFDDEVYPGRPICNTHTRSVIVLLRMYVCVSCAAFIPVSPPRTLSRSRYLPLAALSLSPTSLACPCTFSLIVTISLSLPLLEQVVAGVAAPCDGG